LPLNYVTPHNRRQATGAKNHRKNRVKCHKLSDLGELRSRGTPISLKFDVTWGPRESLALTTGGPDNAAMQADPIKTDPPRRKRRWLQFSLRSLLIFTLICAVGSAWVAHRMEQKRKEREIVAAIIKSGGEVYYDYQVDPSGIPHGGAERISPTGPHWSRQLFGENFFSDVKSVRFKGGDTEFENIKELTQLQTLDLSQSTVTDAGLVLLDRFPRLERLCLGLGTAKIDVTDAGLKHIKRLTQLRELYLDKTKVTDAGLVNIRELTELQLLYLGDTKITDLGLANLKGLSRLQELLLSENVTDEGLVNLTSLTQLRKLWIDGTIISDAGLTHLKGLTQLQILGLARTKVTDAGLVNLKEMNNLHLLDLRETGVADTGLVNLQALAQLQELFVGTSKVTDAGVKDLQKALPNCQISR
jgi:hypothetical protein